MTRQPLSKPLLVAGIALSAAPSALRAADPAEIPWQNLCLSTLNRTLTVTTSSGTVVEGSCVIVSKNEMQVRTQNNGMVRIARANLAKLYMSPSGHELRTLHQDLHRTLKRELDSLLTEKGPFILFAIPPTLAWGVVATPFCALGDFKTSLAKPREIRVI